MHTGASDWGYVATGRFTVKIWITLNGEQVDLRGCGFPTPYLRGVWSGLMVLEVIDRREERARRGLPLV